VVVRQCNKWRSCGKVWKGDEMNVKSQYRIVKLEKPECEFEYGLFEYDLWEDGTTYRMEDADLYAESVDELKHEVELMLDAFNHSVIDEKEAT